MQNRPIPQVDVIEAHRRLTEPVAGEAAPILVDVREVGEFVQARAVGAVLLPLSQFMGRYRELPTDRPLLVICAAGGRSTQAAAFLLANGWDDVTNVIGGTVSWMASGLPARSGPPAADEEDRGF